MALGSTQPLTEMNTKNFLGVRRPVCRADNLTTFMCRLSWSLGASTSWNPVGLSRPVMGLLFYTPNRVLSSTCWKTPNTGHYPVWCKIWKKKTLFHVVRKMLIMDLT